MGAVDEGAAALDRAADITQDAVMAQLNAIARAMGDINHYIEQAGDRFGNLRADATMIQTGAAGLMRLAAGLDHQLRAAAEELRRRG
jgi:hypothetical protein